MSETRSTINTTQAATLPLALHALTGHLLAAKLPAPRDLSLPAYGQPDLIVWIGPEDLDRWIASGFVPAGGQVDTPLSRTVTSERYVRTDVHGHVPSPVGDIRIRLSYVARAVRHLVAATSA